MVRTEEGVWGRPLEFSSDDRFLSVARGLLNYPRWWEVKNSREYRALYGPMTKPLGTMHVDFSPHGSLLASVGYDGIRLWDVAAGKHIAFTASGESSFRFEPNGKSFLAASGPSGLHRWPFALDQDEFGRMLRLGPPEQLAVSGFSPQEVSRDRRTLVAIEPGKGILVLDLGNQSARLLAADSGANDCRLSPDGKWVASGTWHGSGAKVWDAHSGKLERHLTTIDAGVRFSPDGKWLVTGSEKEYQFWQVGSWKSGHKIARKQGYATGSMEFSPDGKLLAIAHSAWDVQLVDPATGRQVATLPNPASQGINTIAFSPDGSQLAVASVTSPLIHLFNLRAIRRQLAAMNLDWNLPAYPAISPSHARDQRAAVKPLQVQLDLGVFIGREKYSLVIAFFPFHAEAYYQRGRAYARFGQWEEAFADFAMAIALKPDHAEAHTALNDLARAYPGAMKLPEAIRLFEQVRDRQVAKLGPDHPSTLSTLHNLALAYWSAKQPDRAVPLFERVLAKRKVKPGADHPDTLLTMANLGVVYRDVGRPTEAVPLMEEVLSRTRKLPGPMPAQLGSIPAEMALTYDRAGQFAKWNRSTASSWSRRASSRAQTTRRRRPPWPNWG